MLTPGYWSWLFAARRVGAVGGCLLSLLLLCACRNVAPPGPLVRLHISGLPPGVERMDLIVTEGGQTKSESFAGNDPFDVLGVHFEPGTVGKATFQADAYQVQGAECLLGS